MTMTDILIAIAFVFLGIVCFFFGRYIARMQMSKTCMGDIVVSDEDGLYLNISNEAIQKMQATKDDHTYYIFHILRVRN